MPSAPSPLVPRCGPALRTSLRWTVRPPATLLDGTAEHTKPKVVEPEARRAPVAERRPADPGDAAPAAAPAHPERAGYRPRRVR